MEQQTKGGDWGTGVAFLGSSASWRHGGDFRRGCDAWAGSSRLDGTVCSMVHAFGIEKDTQCTPNNEMLQSTLEALAPPCHVPANSEETACSVGQILLPI